MAYNRTQTYNELEEIAEGAARYILSAIRAGEDFFSKVVSWGGGKTDAQIASEIWQRDNTLNKALFSNDVAELEATIAEVRALAISINGIVTGVTPEQIEALEVFN